MSQNRLRPRSLDKIDESRAAAAHLSRVDYHLGVRFRRMMVRWAGWDEIRWKNLAILELREIGGWTMEMIGLVFGHPKGHITRIVRDTKAELAKTGLKGFMDHKVDSYAAVQVADAETLLDRLKKNRHLYAANDLELDAAITNLQASLDKWDEPE